MERSSWYEPCLSTFCSLALGEIAPRAFGSLFVLSMCLCVNAHMRHAPTVHIGARVKGQGKSSPCGPCCPYTSNPTNSIQHMSVQNEYTMSCLPRAHNQYFKFALHTHHMQVRNFYVGKDFKGDPPLHLKIAAGLTTGALGIMVASPTDLVKVRHSSQYSRHHGC